MRLETYLNAMLAANTSIVGYENWGWPIDWKKRGRQRDAFRARILRMDAEKDDVIEGQFKSIVRQGKRIRELSRENARLLEKLGVSTTWREDD